LPDLTDIPIRAIIQHRLTKQEFEMATEWNVIERGDRFAVARAVVNSQGKWTPEKAAKTFGSCEAAQAYADSLNQK
jgi:hypothetical protein